MNIVEKFISECNIEFLKQQAQTEINISIMNDWEEESSYIAYLGDIVSGAYGQYQAEYICKYFAIEYSKDFETDWYNIDNISHEIAKKLTELCGLDGYFYFGNLESDGSYGLFYVEEKRGNE